MAEPTTRKTPPWEREDLMLVGKAAEFLGINRVTLWRWVNYGWVQPVVIDGHRYFSRANIQYIRERLDKMAKEKERV